MLKLYKLKDYNFILVGLLAAISIMGVLLVNSADSSLTSRQLFGVIAGFAIMIVVSLIDYSWLLHFSSGIYLINAALLLMVMLFGISTKGAARWISIGGFQFQPTELCKILLIMFLSSHFMKHASDLSSWRVIFQSVILMAVPLFMILRQPDLKNTITLTVVFTCMYFAAGLDYKKIGIILLIIIPLILALVYLVTQTDLHIVDDYQKDRIMAFMEPNNDEYDDAAMQQDNSIMAIGSGRLTGKGLNNSDVSTANKGNFIAEIQNDFIFAVAGEELGFIGCLILILLELSIVLMCLYTGKSAKDLEGRLICDGMASLIAFQSFLNICVATGLLPNTGTTLPFVSYGLTSVISLFIGMGLVLNVGLQKKQYYEDGGSYVYRGETFSAEEA
ncbi:MAG: FtsW/RodA/SpoVE family cell cycle protein [Eubacteriales bacterium]|jgi:rod shape determining protein RodA